MTIDARRVGTRHGSSVAVAICPRPSRWRDQAVCVPTMSDRLSIRESVGMVDSFLVVSERADAHTRMQQMRDTVSGGAFGWCRR